MCDTSLPSAVPRGTVPYCEGPLQTHQIRYSAVYHFKIFRNYEMARFALSSNLDCLARSTLKITSDTTSSGTRTSVVLLCIRCSTNIALVVAEVVLFWEEYLAKESFSVVIVVSTFLKRASVWSLW